MQEQQITPEQGISKHFKRESKWMLWFLIGIPALLAVLGVIAAVVVPPILNANRCIDRSGSISLQTLKCELPEPAPASTQ